MEEYRVLWGKYTWVELGELAMEGAVAVLPVGSTEQHGPHLPLDNDHYTAFRLAVEAAKHAWEKGFKVLVLPPIPYGLSEHWMNNPGTVTLSPRTFIDMVVEVMRSVVSHGFKRIVVLNGHGGNTHALNVAANRFVHEAGDPEVRVVVMDWWRFVGEESVKVLESPIFHADEGETSVAMALGQRVVLDALKGLKPEEPPLPSKWRSLDPTRASRLRNYRYNPRPAMPGAYGEPAKASRDKGEAIVEAFKERFVEMLEDLF